MHFKSNTLKKLKVTTLNKYLENNNLKEFLKLKKNEKCNLISHQIALGHLKSKINWKKDNEKKLKTAQVMSQMNIWIVMTVTVKLMMKKVILSSTVLERIVVLHLKKVMMMMMMAVILIVWIQTVTFAQLKMKIKITMMFQIYLLQLEVDDPLQLGDVHILNVSI